jgi:hypothetical protein
MIPYMKRLFSMGASDFYYSRMAILQEIHASFVPAEFKDNGRLSGEFLLGYDLQRQALYQKYTAEKGRANLDALNRSRDYLFGRLLAVAATIEESAMNEDEKRFTNAESAVPQFSLQPLTVWKAVFEKTLPYGERLIMHGNRGLYTKLTELLEEIHNLFKPEDFNNERLSGEYILGYFAQRNAMNEKISNDPQNVDIDENNRSRDYLYGRLLAVARAVEETVLSVKGRLYSTEDRPTNAERYQRAFSVKPPSTWKHISMKVGVHEAFIKTHLSEDFYEKMRTETETIENAFQPGDFEKEECLSGEYLLGYFKQLCKLAPANKYSKQGENYESKPQN